MRIVFMGTPAFALPALQALIDGEDDVVGVFTQPDRPKGRGGKVQMSPAKELALEHGIPVFQPQRIRRDGLEDLRSLHPDLCVTAAFGQILNQEILDVPALGTVNVHASLLPKHRGSAPVNWAILQGDAETGVTTMMTDKGIDTGDMLLQRKIPIAAEDTAGTLLTKLAVLGAELLIDTLTCIKAGTCPRQAQNESEMTYDPMLTKEMGELDFTQSSNAIVNRVRAMNPWPCAYAPVSGGRLKIWQARASAWSGSEKPGTVLKASAAEGLAIKTADGALEIIELQAPNARRMDARAFLRGHAIQTGMDLKEATI